MTIDANAAAGHALTGHDALLAAVMGVVAILTAIAHPCDPASLVTAADAVQRRLIVPILVGPRLRILAVAAETSVDISGFRLIDAPHRHAAATAAVALVRGGEAQLLMKGSLHTDELIAAVLDHDAGLRTERSATSI